MIAAVGCTLGIIPHLVAARPVIAALLHTSALAFRTLKYLGVAYLLYMAWATLRETGTLTVTDEAAPRSALRVIVSGILIVEVDLRVTQVGVHVLITHVMIKLSLPRAASAGCALANSRYGCWPAPTIHLEF